MQGGAPPAEDGAPIAAAAGTGENPPVDDALADADARPGPVPPLWLGLPAIEKLPPILICAFRCRSAIIP